MRFSIKRFFLKKRTPEHLERLYRRMIAEREAKKREIDWQSIALGCVKHS